MKLSKNKKIMIGVSVLSLISILYIYGSVNTNPNNTPSNSSPKISTGIIAQNNLDRKPILVKTTSFNENLITPNIPTSFEYYKAKVNTINTSKLLEDLRKEYSLETVYGFPGVYISTSSGITVHEDKNTSLFEINTNTSPVSKVSQIDVSQAGKIANNELKKFTEIGTVELDENTIKYYLIDGYEMIPKNQGENYNKITVGFSQKINNYPIQIGNSTIPNIAFDIIGSKITSTRINTKQVEIGEIIGKKNSKSIDTIKQELTAGYGQIISSNQTPIKNTAQSIVIQKMEIQYRLNTAGELLPYITCTGFSEDEGDQIQYHIILPILQEE